MDQSPMNQPDQDQQDNVVEPAAKRLSRRRFTVSGFVSHAPNNPSGVRHNVDGCGGISPGGWKKPDVGGGNSDGNRNQWYAAGYAPNPRGGQHNDPPASLFDDAFGTSTGFGSMHDVLLNRPGTLEFHAVAALLNASLPIPGYMSPDDVIGLYNSALMGVGFVTTGGTEVFLTESELQDFFEQTYH